MGLFGRKKKTPEVNVDELYNVCRMLGQEGKLDEAIQCYDNLLQTDPSHIFARYNQGICYGQNGDMENALKCFLEVHKTAKTFTTVIPRILDALYRLKRYDEVYPTWEKMMDVTLPSDEATEVSNIIGNSFSELGEFDNALEMYDDVLDSPQANSTTQYHKAETLEKMERYGDALKIWDELLEKWPDDPTSLETKGRLLEKLGRNDEAKIYFEKANQNKEE